MFRDGEFSFTKVCYNCGMSVHISLPDTLYQRIKQTAQHHKKTVDEYLIELVSTALEEEEPIVPIPEDHIMADEAKAWQVLYPMLKEKYLGQYVAIYKGDVVDVAPDALTLHRRIKKNYPDKTVWMSQVEETPFREIHMRSPRINK